MSIGGDETPLERIWGCCERERAWRDRQRGLENNEMDANPKRDSVYPSLALRAGVGYRGVTPVPWREGTAAVGESPRTVPRTWQIASGALARSVSTAI